MRFIFILGLVLLGARLAYKKTDGFSMLAISSNHPYQEAFATRPLQDEEKGEVERALSQPYHYFGCGGQAFAFFSEDGRYVIKFFKQRLFRPSWLLNHLPLPKVLYRFREKRNFKRQDKWLRDFSSYKVAFEELHDETEVIFVHLNRTNELKKSLKIRDRQGIWYTLELDNLDFIIQRKAELVYDRVNHLMQAGQKNQAEKAIGAVFKLIKTRADKGYRDRDPTIRTNCGFVGEKAIKIDVGRFVKVSDFDWKAECRRIAIPFREWVESTHPSLVSAFDTQLEEVLSE